MSLQLRQLRHAVFLAEAGTYSAAARKLNITQPALSRSIQALEDLLGARLFDRTARGAEPTEIGEVLVRRGKRLLGGASELEREIRLAIGAEIGSLRIGAAPYPAEISVGTACGRLSLSHPALGLDVRVGDWQFLTSLVLAGELDIAVAELSVARQDTGLTTEALPRHQGYFVCRAQHPLARQRNVSLVQVSEYPLVTSSLPERLGNLAPAIRVDAFQLVRDIVLSSNALGLATASQAPPGAGGGLVRLPLELPWLHTDYGFIRLKDRTPSPAGQAFMDILRAVEAGLEGTPADASP